MAFVVPKIDQILLFKGNQETNQPVENIKFTGINFRYSAAPRGINVDKQYIDDNTKAIFPWLDLTTGFSDIQTSVECGQAILLQGANHITFSDCSFSLLGNYAIRIDKYSNFNRIADCSFYDLGGGGIVIGYNDMDPVTAGVPPLASPSNNVVESCSIHDLGIIYPGSVAIGIMNATGSNISCNAIYNGSYTGISCGFTWGYGKSYTFGDTIQNNDIHNVMTLLADGGGIYTLGVQPQTVITGNTIHDVYRSRDATGSQNNGIFFDDGSSQMFVDKNVIYNIQNQKMRYNQTTSSNMKWGTRTVK